MKRPTKLQVHILIYCALLWFTNFTLTHNYYRSTGLTSSSVAFQGIGFFTGIIGSYVFGRRIWKLTRKLLDRSVRIPQNFRLWGNWGFLILLLPLLHNSVHHSYGVAGDGARIETVFEYGGDSSALSFLFAGIAIMLFQLLVRLETFDPDKIKAQISSRASLSIACE